MSEIIKTENLTFSYPPDEGKEPVLALGGVSLAIEQGSFVAVLGHNGSGKSTLAKHMNAVLLPEGGTVWVDGMDTRDENLLLEVRRRVGLATEDIRLRVDSALQAVRMGEFQMHAPHHLSGGQKQRIAIAGVIAMEPKCIVLDESTAMLDPLGRREVLDTVSRLNREKGITIVLITHHMDEAALADRVVVMDSGKVAMDGTPREVLVRVEELRAIGLDAPHTVELLHGLRQDGFDVPLDALGIEECAEAIVRAL